MQLPIGQAHPTQKQNLIAIGASTGGVDALETLCVGLQPPMPPILIVQHMPAFFTPKFAARLDKQLPLHVVEAQAGMTVETDTIYLAPGDYHMGVQEHGDHLEIHLDQSPRCHSQRPAIDKLFFSLTDLSKHYRLLAIILTGMGSDGSHGLQKLSAAGAETWTQDEDSSSVYGMPKAACELGASKRQLSPRDMAHEIHKWSGSGHTPISSNSNSSSISNSDSNRKSNGSSPQPKPEAAAVPIAKEAPRTRLKLDKNEETKRSMPKSLDSLIKGSENHSKPDKIKEASTTSHSMASSKASTTSKPSTASKPSPISKPKTATSSLNHLPGTVVEGNRTRQLESLGPSSLVELIYCSASVASLTNDDVTKIIRNASEKNHRHNISSVLCFANGYFMQILEGPPRDVNNLYNDIVKDKRHHHIALISYMPITKKNLSKDDIYYFGDRTTMNLDGKNIFHPDHFGRDQALSLARHLINQQNS